MSYRAGWREPRTKMCELSEDFEVLQNFDIELDGRRAEDARLFMYKGDLWTSYTCYHAQGVRSHQRYARIDEYGTVREDYGLTPPSPRVTEKNWQFFEHDGKLYTAYLINPHKIFEVQQDQVIPRHTTAIISPWEYGELHGGTPPIEVDGYYYSFFHSWIAQPPIRRKYYAGVYRFHNKPPFKVANISKRPLMEASSDDMKKYAVNHESAVQSLYSIVFPGGAIFENGKWTISYGYQDAECRIAQFTHEEIENTFK